MMDISDMGIGAGIAAVLLVVARDMIPAMSARIRGSVANMPLGTNGRTLVTETRLKEHSENCAKLLGVTITNIEHVQQRTDANVGKIFEKLDDLTDKVSEKLADHNARIHNLEHHGVG